MFQDEQLALFEVPAQPRKQSQKQQLEGLVDTVLQTCIDQGIDPMQLAAELQFREVCDVLDRWPARLRKQFVAKLVRRYIGYNN